MLPTRSSVEALLTAGDDVRDDDDVVKDEVAVEDNDGAPGSNDVCSSSVKDEFWEDSNNELKEGKGPFDGWNANSVVKASTESLCDRWSEALEKKQSKTLESLETFHWSG
jgi:hypothetical protein